MPKTAVQVIKVILWVNLLVWSQSPEPHETLRYLCFEELSKRSQNLFAGKAANLFQLLFVYKCTGTL